MNTKLFIGLLAAVFLLGAEHVRAAAPVREAESRAFDAAVRAFADKFFDRAERELGEFILKFPDSPQLVRAALLQAQARLSLGDSKGALALLAARVGAAGALADEYRFWLGEAHFAAGDFKAAAAEFAQVLALFPQSQRRLEAAYREAVARFKLGEVARVIELLRAPTGAFARAAQLQPASAPAVGGLLLLAETLLSQKDHAGALKVLEGIGGGSLAPDLAWLRGYWITRALLESDQAAAALPEAEKLVTLAAATKSVAHAAEAYELQGEILIQLKRPDDAIQSFERNLAPGLPAERRRPAILKIIQISLAQDQPARTAQWLERFLKDHPQDPSLDIIRLTLAEARLKQYFGVPVGGAEPAARSNLLAEARTQLDRFLGDFPNNALAARAQLARGLVQVEDGRLPEARGAFQFAADRLPPSEDQAAARFRLADVLFQQGEFRAALTNYQTLVSQYASTPSVRDGLFDHALYQIIRASIELGDLDAASAAMRRLLEWYPESFFGDRSLLLLGQALNRRGESPQARAVFVSFLQRFPGSPLASEVHLAIARTYVLERDWVAAIGKYEDWVRNHPEHPARARGEFDLAWVNAQSGRLSNAFALFTSFTNRFPTNPLAPHAQHWKADYYWNLGDYTNAEKNYQLLFQNTNWAASKEGHFARLMAGKAAFARQGFKEAKEYFAQVFNDDSAPVTASLQALMLWGDAVKEEPGGLDKFAEAINAFGRITNRAPADPLVPAALGSIGNCHFQIATQDPKRYDLALEAYRRALDHPAAEVAVRSQLWLAVGQVYEKQAQLKPAPEQAPLLKLALDSYLNVIYGGMLRTGELADPYWIKENGVCAGRLLEAQGRWDDAIRVYQRVLEVAPAAKPVERLLQLARDRQRAGVN